MPDPVSVPRAALRRPPGRASLLGLAWLSVLSASCAQAPRRLVDPAERSAPVAAAQGEPCEGRGSTPGGDPGLARALEAVRRSVTPRPGGSPRPAWVARSNENAQLLLAVQARFDPERAAAAGIEGLDAEIIDLQPGHRARREAALREARGQLAARRVGEPDLAVRKDLALLLDAADRELRGLALRDRLRMPYRNLASLVFSSVHGLLDPQVAPERRPAVLLRLRKYAGLEPGYRPLADLARAELEASLDRPGLAAPSKLELEYDLKTGPALIDGVGTLCRKFELDCRESLANLRPQLEAYAAFVRERVLPRARADFRLPAELYAFALEQFGVDLPPQELAARAHEAFDQIRREMAPVAARVARARGLPSTDYREVICALKKEQIPNDQILAHYEHRLAEIEGIIRTRKLVTMPDRPARIRLGTPAENAQQPAPHMEPPRMVGNRGEQGAFVLPLSVPTAKDSRYDDFTFAAASWTLTAHEARPGHELQFARMVEQGTSLARAIFAANSANIEGWGLYAEKMMLPYMPDEGKLVSLQLRLQRAARAFLDPELQQGKWTPDAARQLLEREVGLSPAFATSEVDRYTFRAPGQATSYYYGLTKLLELRAEVEARAGASFDAQRFHDAVLAQGLLPHALLRDAVLEELALSRPAPAGQAP